MASKKRAAGEGCIRQRPDSKWEAYTPRDAFGKRRRVPSCYNCKMTLLFEISKPAQLRPWFDKTAAFYRAGWLWFAVGWLRIPFDEAFPSLRTLDQ